MSESAHVPADSLNVDSPATATADEDLLVGATWSELKFISATGDMALTQDLDYRTEAIFALDGTGKPILYVLGKKIDLYDVIWPLAKESGEPEAPAGE